MENTHKLDNNKRYAEDEEENSHKRAKGEKKGFSLEAILPIEIWKLLLTYFTFWEKRSFARTCRKIYQLCKITELPPCYYGRCSKNHAGTLTKDILKILPLTHASVCLLDEKIRTLDLWEVEAQKYRDERHRTLTELVSEPFLQFYSTVTSLKFERKPDTINLDQLANLNILNLDFSTDCKIDPSGIMINGMDKMTNLTSLVMSHHHAYAKSLTHLTNLRQLAAPGDLKLRELKRMTKLEDLDIRECIEFGINGFQALQSFTNLQKLKCQYSPSEDDGKDDGTDDGEDILKGFSNLTYLELKGDFHFSGADNVTLSLNYQSLTNLKKFVLGYFGECETINLELPTSLICLKHRPTVVPNDHWHLPNLERLSTCSEHFKETLGSMTKLTSLFIPETNCQQLMQLINLKTLRLEQGEYDLTPLTNLESLHLGKDAVVDLSTFSTLTKLTELTLEKQDVEFLHSTTVTKLTLKGTNKVNLKLLERMSSLKRLEMIFGLDPRMPEIKKELESDFKSNKEHFKHLILVKLMAPIPYSHNIFDSHFIFLQEKEHEHVVFDSNSIDFYT